jgi:hypothetical protein
MSKTIITPNPMKNITERFIDLIAMKTSNYCK